MSYSLIGASNTDGRRASAFDAPSNGFMALPGSDARKLVVSADWQHNTLRASGNGADGNDSWEKINYILDLHPPSRIVNHSRNPDNAGFNREDPLHYGWKENQSIVNKAVLNNNRLVRTLRCIHMNTHFANRTARNACYVCSIKVGTICLKVDPSTHLFMLNDTCYALLANLF